MNAVAYFGISEVHYLVGDVYFTLEFPGSNLVIPKGEMPTGSVTNYFYGSDSSLWKTGLADCAELRYREIYPGIDLVYKIQNGYIKYEFVLAPYADPTTILLKYADVDTIQVHDERISVSKDGHEIEDAGLWAFQMISGTTDVDCIDTDCDNLNDAFEVKIGTDPLNDDSDGDSYLDGLEVIAGTNPLDALDYPGSTRGSDPTLLIVLVAGSGIAVIIILITIRKMRGRS